MPSNSRLRPYDRNLSENDRYNLSLLANSHTTLQKIFDIIPAGLYIKNEAGQYLFMNETIKQMLFPPGVSMIGKTDEDIFPDSVVKKIRRRDLDVFKSHGGEHSATEKIPTSKGDKYFLTKKRSLPNIFEGKGDMIVGNASDITELKRAQGELDKANNFLRKINQLTPHVIFLFDLNRNFIYQTNLAFEKIFGYKGEDLTPEFWMSIISNKVRFDKKNFVSRLRQLEKGEVMIKELQYIKSNGSKVWTKNSITPFDYDECGEVSSVMVSIENIHQVKVLQERFRRKSHSDHLTKLYNRRYFIRNLRSSLTKKKPFTLLFVDLNDFKSINDSYGHDVGDKVLIDTAKKLRSVFRRETDVVARLGGDEFVVLINGGLQDSSNEPIPKKIRAQFLIPYESEDFSLGYKPSVGAVLVEHDYNITPENVLQKADQAMYKAKKLNDLQVISV